MTKQEKNFIERWIFILAITLIASALVGLQLRKAENIDLNRIVKSQEQQCEKTEKLEEIIIDIRLNLQEIKTLIKDKR